MTKIVFDNCLRDKNYAFSHSFLIRATFLNNFDFIKNEYRKDIVMIIYSRLPFTEQSDLLCNDCHMSDPFCQFFLMLTLLLQN